jgi:hypothetical protein
MALMELLLPFLLLVVIAILSQAGTDSRDLDPDGRQGA